MENLECPVCLDQAIDAVECTQCAAIFCEACTKALKKCPLCRVAGSFKESAFARKLINNLPKKCDFCDFTCPQVELKYHYPKCTERVMKCNVCVFQGKKDDFFRHIANGHTEDLFKNFTTQPNSKPQISILWENKTKLLRHSYELLTTQTALQSLNNFDIKIRIKKCKNAAYIVVGFSNKKMHVAKGFLGGDLGTGNWGYAGNGALGEEGKWQKTDKYKQGDIITLIYDNGIIRYEINGKKNNYNYRLMGPVYLACSLYHNGDELEIF